MVNILIIFGIILVFAFGVILAVWLAGYTILKLEAKEKGVTYDELETQIINKMKSK